jgi:hypothetical protein
MPYKPLTAVYKAFSRSGRDKVAGIEKEAFLALLQTNGIDVEKVSIYRLSKVLCGRLRIEDLKR